MNQKIQILVAIFIVLLFLAGCGNSTSINMPQQNQDSKIVEPTSNGEITKSPEATTPIITNSTSNTIDYNQYMKKTWIKSENDSSQESGVSFTITKIENNEITGELTVVGLGQSCPNTVADLTGIINNDTAECHFTDSRGNEGTIKLIFKSVDTIDATISLTNKSDDDIAQPPEGTFQFSALNLKDIKEFSPMEEHSFILELNSWGKVRFVSGKFTSDDYVPVGFYLTDKDGDILYGFEPTITYNVDIKAVSFKDVNNDGRKDIIIIAAYSDDSEYLATVYLQKPDGSFGNDPELDQEINDTGSNKDVKSVTNYLSQKETSDQLILLIENKAKDMIENPELQLISGYKLISVVTGDLNADSYSDLVVVVEHTPGDVKGTRTIYVLLQNLDGTYNVVEKNNNIIHGKEEGGIWGDPFQNIEINNGELNVYEYSGSNFRGVFSNQFKYIANDFILIHAQRIDYYTGTGRGLQTDFNFSDRSVKCSSWSENESYETKLVFSYELSKKYYFNAFDIDDFENSIVENSIGLPDLGWYEFDKYKAMLDLKISTNKALELVKNYLNINMDKVNISWTPETKDNYSSLIFYTVPDFYYKKDNRKLYYYKYEENVHTIILKDDNGNLTFYEVNDETGKVIAE